jgi:hypothetical protein
MRDTDSESIEMEAVLEFASREILTGHLSQSMRMALLACPAGAWQSVVDLDSSGALQEALQRYPSELTTALVNGLALAWTLNPNTPEDPTSCAILFFYYREDTMWSKVSIVNRPTLET